MNPERLQRLPLVSKLFRKELNDSERHAKIEKVLQDQPLTNREIWFYILSKRGFLTSDERFIIINYYETYKKLWPAQEVSVGVLLNHARIKNLENDKYLKSVSFNYEKGLDVYDRWEKAVKELESHKIKSVGVLNYDPQYWDVQRCVKDDFEKLSHEWVISYDNNKNKFLPNRDHLDTDHLTNAISIHKQEILPLLQAGELVKSGFEHPFIIGSINQQPKITGNFLPIAQTSSSF